jgi:O-acetyl-ADP-ribose deacetylase (regulator of RNase III)
MLKYTDLSLFDSPAQTLVNTVNTVGVMGKGIALEFRQRYPDMFLKYKDHCSAGLLDIGKLYLYRTEHHWVLNFPTKRHWRNPSKPEWIELGLEKFAATYLAQGITSVSFPQLGCGNGGLNWESDVQPLMVKYLEKLPIPVYVHIAPRDTAFFLAAGST